MKDLALYKDHYQNFKSYEPEIFGRITLYNVDCMEILPTIPDQAFDLAIVDPPYGIEIHKAKLMQENMRRCRQKSGATLSVRGGYYTKEAWDDACPSIDYFHQLFRVSKNQIIFGVNYFPFNELFTGGRIVWDKCNGENSFSDAEIAYCSFHKRIRLFRYMWSGMCQGKSITEGHIQQGNKKLNEKRIHPTQKPVALYKWILSNYAKPGNRILDTHLGSGSICIACDDTGFEMTGIEVYASHFDAAKKRLIEHRLQQKLF